MFKSAGIALRIAVGVTLIGGADQVRAGAPAGCDGLHQSAKLTAPGANNGQFLGWSVSISDVRVVAGAPLHDVVGMNSGSVRVFVRSTAASGWSRETMLSPDDAQAGDSFGRMVSLDGDVLAVLSPQDQNAGSGAVYLFERSTEGWAQTQRIANPGTGVWLSRGLHVQDGLLLFGGVRSAGGGLTVDRTFVFEYSGGTWVPQADLAPLDEVAGEATDFGGAIDRDGDTLIIAADHDDDGGAYAGAAYIFVRTGSTWTQQAKLTASDRGPHDFFGSDVAISGETAVVGAYQADGGCIGNPSCLSSGAVYVYVRSGSVWTEQAVLRAADAEAEDFFGASVDIDGDTIIVGARHDDDACPTNPGCNSGSAYVFHRVGTAWHQYAKLTASDATVDEKFGFAVALQGSTAISGATYDAAPQTYSGSVFTFELPVDCNANGALDKCESNDCNLNGLPDDCDIAAFVSADCDADGQPDECQSGACCSGGACAESSSATCVAYTCHARALYPAGWLGCLGDVDGNNVVNPADRGSISANIGESDHDLICLFDLDGNGTINPADRGVISANIGLCTPLPDYMDGCGMNGGSPDTRFGSSLFFGLGTDCGSTSCP